MPTPRLFPRRTLEQALRVPLALRENNGGNPWKSAEVAKAIGLGPSTGNFFYVTAASRDYGLTEGTRDTAQISLLPLGRRVVYPASAADERSALLQAFFSVDVFKRVLEHFGGNKLPERRFLTNILRETFSIPEDQHDEFVDIFTKNCRFLGIGGSYQVNGAGDRPPAIRDRVDGTAGDTVTVAAPEGDEEAPVCFVVMPFTERDEIHDTGFFDEVLDNLFTPAITNAGFKVTTAKRHGSDIIQSTIVNDLLDADLVLVDLTEHNPNVLFELGMRITEQKPVALVRARGTGPIFDVDHLLRVVEYSPNLWPSTVAVDIPKLTDHIKGAWDARANPQTFMNILRQRA